ncbi:quinone oxidoreductase family protein [Paenarthrobacter ureafaciens]|uniref:quinone oxidoreductase family protein n=1 Tax=Paenarthrobacter ureafaciens TaxID=37931 RepID=UPI002DBCC4AD|nr:zinc-binding alcohol dehydrogenase family protein [Paenarthrobacter ureafaciens]MEC3853978.1 zinc-binding alcohol dehydrogenase family protein [Paenarthrobacter ureafaciens]
MKAAVLTQTGTMPEYADFPEPQSVKGYAVVDITAAGVHHLDLARASGAYGNQGALPYVIGADGVGRTSTGRRVFFTAPVSPHGSWAERTLVAEQDLLDLADDIDDVTAAALGNTGLAAWLALTWRANLQPGQNVLVLGATGALGSVAVQLAKALGAADVVAADRDSDRLANSRQRGATATVTITPDTDLVDAFRNAVDGRGFDVIIDPVWGEPALAAMHVAARGARHIQIGQSAAETIQLPASIIRSARLELLGFAHVDPSAEIRRNAYLKLTELAATGALTVDTTILPLTECRQAWEIQQQGSPRKLVLTP